MYLSNGKSFTSEPIWHPKGVGSKLVMRSMPDLPASRLTIISSMLCPHEVTALTPVTTTLCRCWRSDIRGADRAADCRAASGLLLPASASAALSNWANIVSPNERCHILNGSFWAFLKIA